jgi:ubiquinone/menaquinone biosynthesis C-methylase UbiE
MISALTVCIVQFNAIGQSDNWKNVYTESAWEERDAWQKPGDLISRMAISKGSTVADIGCHEGYMSFKLSAVVGDQGRVYAVDVEQNKLEKLEAHAKERGVTNVKTIKGDYDDPKLPDATLDAVIIVDTYHEMDDHDDILSHVFKSLKTGGRLVICEPIADSRKDLPRADQENKHELAMKHALEDLQRAGFKIQEKKENFVDRVKVKGDRMWVVVAVK